MAALEIVGWNTRLLPRDGRREVRVDVGSRTVEYNPRCAVEELTDAIGAAERVEPSTPAWKAVPLVGSVG